jgi:hypothetical protein
MHSQIDLDPTHGVIRLTVMEESVSLECAEDVYQRLSALRLAAACTRASTTSRWRRVRRYPPRWSGILRAAATRYQYGERKHVVVGKEPQIYGLARLFQICGDNVGKEFEVVHTLEEAYEIVGVRPEDFTECLLPERPTA